MKATSLRWLMEAAASGDAEARRLVTNYRKMLQRKADKALERDLRRGRHAPKKSEETV